MENTYVEKEISLESEVRLPVKQERRLIKKLVNRLKIISK
jgi:hypothetical protein